MIPARAGPRARALAAAAAFYALAAAVFTWPLVLHLGSGLPDLWDAKLNAWILNWDFHQTFRDPLHLFDANIFYPARYVLAFSENLYGAAVFGFPLYAAGASSLLVYNVLFLLGMWLSAMAAWALAREINADALASLVAGVVYAFIPWRLAQLPHIQFQWGAFLALLLLFLMRFFEGGRLRDAVLFGLCFAGNALCNVHYALFSGLLVLVVAAHETLARGWRAMRGRLAGAALAVASAGLVLLPFYLPYRRASQLYGMRRGWGEIESFSGRLIDFLTAGPQNKLYASLTQKWAQPEGDFFPGISVVLLAAAAAAALAARGVQRAPGRPARPPRPRWLLRTLDALIAADALLWLAATLRPGLVLGPVGLGDPGRVVVFATAALVLRLALAFPQASRFSDLGDWLRRGWTDRRASVILSVTALGVVIALGTHTPYYRFLVKSFGAVFRAIRVPSRGIVLVGLGLGVLAAWGLALTTRRLSRPGRLAAAAAALSVIGFEYRAFPIDIGDVPEEPAPVYRWLAATPFPGAVVEWPLATDPDVEHTFRSTVHWKPLVNGYSGFGPPEYHELSGQLARRPIPPAVWEAMEERGASVLVFHPHEIEEPESRAAYLRALLDGVEGGRAVLLGSLPAGPSRDYVFRLAGAAPFPAGIQEPRPGAAAEDAMRRLRYLESVVHSPFGYVDAPKEGQTVAPGDFGFGWALDDSGIRQVRMSTESQAAVSLSYGSPHPGPAAVHPAFPDAARAGFGFAIPALPPGPHVLTFTFIAKDGGKAELMRLIRVR
ncbi:MAG: hypothetical protein ACRD00_07900 [Thermoanaerobaculia bacterium]